METKQNVCHAIGANSATCRPTFDQATLVITRLTCGSDENPDNTEQEIERISDILVEFMLILRDPVRDRVERKLANQRRERLTIGPINPAALSTRKLEEIYAMSG